MQRPIKFRIWNTKLKKWVTQVSLSEIENSNHNNGLIGIIASTNEEDPETQSAEDCIVQQFTGILDSEGKEIYEGDILSWHGESSDERIAPVIFSPSCAAFVLDSSGRHEFDDKYGDYCPLHRRNFYKIVGNIFEK